MRFLIIGVLSLVILVVLWDNWRLKKKLVEAHNGYSSLGMEIFFKDMELEKSENKIRTLRWHNGHNIEQIIEDNSELETNNRKLRKRIARLGKKRGKRCIRINSFAK